MRFEAEGRAESNLGSNHEHTTSLYVYWWCNGVSNYAETVIEKCQLLSTTAYQHSSPKDARHRECSLTIRLTGMQPALGTPT